MGDRVCDPRIKVLDGQPDLNTTTFTYTIDQKLDAIAQARVGSSSSPPLVALKTSAAGTAAQASAAPVSSGPCEKTVIVRGINAQGQEEEISLKYKVAERDIQDMIAAETNPTQRAKNEQILDGWRSGDEVTYGGTAYQPVAGADASLKSNCAGSVIENTLNRVAALNGLPLQLGPGQSDATALRDLAKKFGTEVPLSGADEKTVISHDKDNGTSAHERGADLEQRHLARGAEQGQLRPRAHAYGLAGRIDH